MATTTNRSFALDYSSIGISSGTFRSSGPAVAAKKAASKLFEKSDSKTRKITFCLRESTRGSKKKQYHYTATKVQNKILVSSAQKQKRSRRVKGGEVCKNFILITDIGRDIDDTLALIVLLSLHKQNKIKLPIIVAAGYNVETRVKLIYYWLKKYNINDISVIPCKKLTNKNIDPDNSFCFEPTDDIYDTIDTFISEYVNSYKNINEYLSSLENEKCNILGIANLACLLDIDEEYYPFLNTLYIQGSFKVEYSTDNSTTKIIPNDADYNLNIGKYPQYLDLSKEVFEKFSSITQFKCVGKNTCYLTEFREDDFQQIDKVVGSTLKNQVEDGLIKFSQSPFFTLVFPNNLNVDIKSMKEYLNNFKDQITNNATINPEEIIIEAIDEFKNDVNTHRELFLKLLNKYSNSYDLVLVYLALQDNRLVSQKVFNETVITMRAKYSVNFVEQLMEYIQNVKSHMQTEKNKNELSNLYIDLLKNIKEYTQAFNANNVIQVEDNKEGIKKMNMATAYAFQIIDKLYNYIDDGIKSDGIKQIFYKQLHSWIKKYKNEDIFQIGCVYRNDKIGDHINYNLRSSNDVFSENFRKYRYGTNNVEINDYVKDVLKKLVIDSAQYLSQSGGRKRSYHQKKKTHKSVPNKKTVPKKKTSKTVPKKK